MSWKPTVAMGVVLAGMLAFYFLYQPEHELPDLSQVAVDADFKRIEIEREGSRIVLARARDASGEHWRIEEPVSRRADPLKVNAIISSIRFRPARAILPGDEEWKPEAFGVDKPQVTVRVDGKHVLLFGKKAVLDPDKVYVKVEGKKPVYVTSLASLEHLELEAKELRDRRVAFFDAQFVRTLAGRRKVTRVGPGGVETEYREFEARFSPSGVRRGWQLEKPHEERLDDTRVNTMLSALGGLEAQEFRALDEKAEAVFESPAFVLEVGRGEETPPVKVAFGEMGFPKTGTVPVRVEGEEEYAVVEQAAVERISGDCNAYRTDDPFGLEMDQLSEIEISVPGPSEKALLVLYPEKTKEGDLVRTMWKVKEPADLVVEKGSVEPLVRDILSLKILSYLPPQENLKQFGLDPPTVTLTLRAGGEGEALERKFLFGLVGEMEEGHLRKGWHDELHRVPAAYVRMLSLADLRVRTREMFNVPREWIAAFAFDWTLPLGNLYYRVARTKEGEWEFVDARNVQDRREVDPDRVKEVLSQLNYVRAESFVGRGAEVVKKYELGGKRSHGRIGIWYEKEGKREEKVLRVSRNLGRSDKPLYYALFEGSSVVFRLDPGIIGLLRENVDKRPKPLHEGHE